MADYEGMRWFKCDFQVQTPEDGANWSDVETRLSEPRRPLIASTPDANGNVGPNIPNEGGIQEAARVYLRRCHSLDLEVIGVTDHNFSQKTEPRDWFLTHLVEQNKSVARELNRAPLYILPGFEVDIGYHVLCLFNPAKKISHVRRTNMLLTKFGLGESQRFRAGRPEPLRMAGENVSLKKLLDVAQKEHDGIIIAAHADQHDGILTQARNIGDYQHLDLMAVEVTASPPAQPYLDILNGRNTHWSREHRQPAYVMSSDAKSLCTDSTGAPVANSLGYRHSWVKMSKPSTEALRQAFLDPRSRVRILGERPCQAQTHPRINSISVCGAKYLADQEVHFSGSLNCVIGGRGSGKSSLLEYMRFAIGMDEIKPEEMETTLGIKREQLRSTLTGPGAEVRITFQAEGGVADTLVYKPSNPAGQQRYIEGRQVDDLATVLRQLQVQFFGQGELSRMTGNGGGRGQVLDLIDVSSGAALINLQVRERDLQARLMTLFQARRDTRRLFEEINVAKQEATELERQLKAREAVQGDSTRNQSALHARRFLDELVRVGEGDVLHLKELTGLFARAEVALPGTASEWPEPEWFKLAAERTNEARGVLLKELSDAALRFEQALVIATGAETTKVVRSSIQAAQQRFSIACSDKGILPEDIARLQELEESKQQKVQLVDARQHELAEVKRRADEFPAVLAELHAVWREQFEIRRSTGLAMQASVASQTVVVTTEFMADKSSFTVAWQRLAPKDGRGKLARRWDELGDDLFKTWRNRCIEMSPWETLEAARVDPTVIPYLYGELAEDLQPALNKYLEGVDVQRLWESVRISRINDEVDVELRRDDGSAAGTMSGALSEGQRNTVLLNLMLARGTGPIVIDQPEDELDSSFIYKTLVKDLRATKNRRQLIVATHNANLPVNGDAEFIYALEARDGRGKMLAKGGLDRAEVAAAVLDIMEGTEQAFKRRSEKYHF